MRTISDVVLEHVAQSCKHSQSTNDAKVMLELPLKYEFNAAGNIYLAALSIIVELQNELSRLRHAPDPLGESLNSGDGSYRP